MAPELAEAVLYTNNDVAGPETGAAELIACKAMRGIKIPKLGVLAASISNKAEGWALAPVPLIPIF